MSLFSRVRAWFGGTPGRARPDRGLLVFANTGEVLRAEKALTQAGFSVQVQGPPPELRTGCDLVVVFPLVDQLRALRVLDQAGLPPLQAVPAAGPLLEPVSLYQVKDFGPWLMVRAANMKLTVDKRTRVIVNISGGGCPDVPWLARELTGMTLDAAPRPRDLGHTLCGFALDLAFEEMLRRCSP